MAFKILQITNIGAAVTADQMRTLFSFIGTVEDVKLYPESENPLISVQSKICFCKFTDEEDAGVALHLNNTVFIDRALIVAPYPEAKIPDENVGLKAMAVAPQAASGSSKFPRWPPNVTNTVVGTGPGAVVHTQDPKFEALGLPPYPPLPASTDPQKIDEIRRSIYVGNLDAFQVTPEALMQFFSQAGEIMYVRMAGDQTQPTRFAFIEFSHQSSVATALSFNGMMFLGRGLKTNHSTAVYMPRRDANTVSYCRINHSNSAITKPAMTNQSAHRDIEEVMRKVKEADKLITAAIDPAVTNVSSVFQRKLFGISGEVHQRSRTRSRSRDRRRRSRSRKRSRRSRSRSRGRKSSRSRRSRSKEAAKKSDKSSGSKETSKKSDKSSGSRRRSKSRGRRSKSRDRKRSRRSRSRRHSKSKSKEAAKRPDKGSRSKEAAKRPDKGSRDRRRRSRSKDRPRRKSRSKDRSHKRSRSRSKDRKSKKLSRRSKSKSSDRRREKERRTSTSTSRSSKKTPVKRDYDEEEKGYDEAKAAKDKKRDSSDDEDADRQSPARPMEVEGAGEQQEEAEEASPASSPDKPADQSGDDDDQDKAEDSDDSHRQETPKIKSKGDDTPSMDESD